MNEILELQEKANEIAPILNGFSIAKAEQILNYARLNLRRTVVGSPSQTQSTSLNFKRMVS